MVKSRGKFKKRIGWISVAMVFIITHFTSFSNHPERGYVFLGIGIILLFTAFLIPLKTDEAKN